MAVTTTMGFKKHILSKLTKIMSGMRFGGSAVSGYPRGGAVIGGSAVIH
jgi:hypothetical protein